ncbi:Txe/YoeB family addiction module toxin [Candidatus Methylobacter oryzae]|uniref:Putative mRNA interferase YoeB n=1 Tax=Candidatus Methylobacter oryzae TaxID=2497749 RepID=A0ABY3C6P6_9GAMM|nr:Txe/YoeB family addiction module toxin [Candidatus Methylobacter oryzae]TRW91227.1 Txe/YoeB family addiction module toxin [Candidatus Methylobacter oryzae]
MKNKKSKNKQQVKSAQLSWTPIAWDDYLSWQKEDQKIVNEINNLIEECRRNPFKGTGKPEPLKGDLTGYWSRRITSEHRLIYLPDDGNIYIVSCRYHY